MPGSSLWGNCRLKRGGIFIVDLNDHRFTWDPFPWNGDLVGGNSNIFFMIHPYLGKIPILSNIFQLGWNHQLGNVLPSYVLLKGICFFHILPHFFYQGWDPIVVKNSIFATPNKKENTWSGTVPWLFGAHFLWSWTSHVHVALFFGITKNQSLIDKGFSSDVFCQDEWSLVTSDPGRQDVLRTWGKPKEP